jgi:hypothetical protein
MATLFCKCETPPRALEIYEEDRHPNYNLSHHLAEFAKIYEAQEK